MSAITTAPSSRSAGERVELGRYRTAHGARVLVGQRVFGVVRVSDVPSGGRGRHYLVERELTSEAELDALVADYLAQARTHADCPMRVPALDSFEASRGAPARVASASIWIASSACRRPRASVATGLGA